jgi:hypothetical protein
MHYISGAQPVVTAGHSDTSGLVNYHKGSLNLNINIFHVLILRCNKDSTRHVGYIRVPQVIHLCTKFIWISRGFSDGLENI